jgi:hypothetical protein
MLREAVMNLLTSQMRTLRVIERDLADTDPQMAALFLTFTVRTRDQELPAREMLRAGPVRALAGRMRAGSPAGWAGAWRTWLAAGLVLIVLAVVCTLAVTGVKGGPARECPPGFAQHVQQGTTPWCSKFSWPAGK